MEDIELVDPTLAVVVIVVVIGAALNDDAEGEEAEPVLANCCCCCCGGSCCCCPLVKTEPSSYMVEVYNEFQLTLTLYSRRLSREKTFTNFSVLRATSKSFLHDILGMSHPPICDLAFCESFQMFPAIRQYSNISELVGSIYNAM